MNTTEQICEHLVNQARETLRAAGYILPTLWHVDDIKGVIDEMNTDREEDSEPKIEYSDLDLTRIIDLIDKNHDAGEGLNWNTIQSAIETHFNL